MSKTSEWIALFHEMKCAVVARLSEGRSPEFRSRRHMSPWNSNRLRFCEVFFRLHYFPYLLFYSLKKQKFLYLRLRFFLLFMPAYLLPPMPPLPRLA